MRQVFYITNDRQLDNIQRVFRSLAKYDVRTFELIKHQKIKEKSRAQKSRGSVKSPFIPRRELLQGLASIMGRQYGSVPPAFLKKLFGGGFAPQRGDAAYNVYLAAQKQRLAHYLKNMDMFADPRQSLMTNRGQYIATYYDDVSLFQEDGQVGSSLNKFLTED